jgi:HAD superfamily hydrolase (TIGR01509 family)
MVIRGVVFDFDGLILDTESPGYEAWAELYRRHGEELSVEFWRTIIGHGSNRFDPIADLERRLGTTLEREVVRAERRRREFELLSGLDVLPGVREWRAEAVAMGLALGVASSSTRAWVVGHLERLGLDGWRCVRCRDDVAHAKPEPDAYLAVTVCMGVTPAEAIAIEDSTAGVQAAKAAGLYCVAVPGPMTLTHDLSRADLILGSLAERSLASVIAGAGRQRDVPTSQNASS